MIQTVRQYGELGWMVVPLYEIVNGGCSCPRAQGCSAPGKHPRIKGWQLAASNDRDTIEGWWTRWPNANVGLLTGLGRVVLDVDRRNGGRGALAELEHTHGPLPDTLTTITGNGEHHHFSIPSSLPSGVLAPGIEIKAAGGLVVLPPSIHYTGHRYEWESSCPPPEESLAPLPDWIVEHLKRGQHRAPRNVDGWAAQWLRTPIEPGGRRGPDGIPRIVGYLRGHGVDCETAIAILELWDNRNPVPLGATEVRRHVTAMYERYGIPPARDPASKSARTTARNRRPQRPTIALERGLVIVRE